MPHYVEEYDEPLSEHLAAEFGEELAISLAENTQLTSPVKKGVITVNQKAIQQRERLLLRLNGEATELDQATATLTDLKMNLDCQGIDQP